MWFRRAVLPRRGIEIIRVRYELQVLGDISLEEILKKF